MQKHLDYLLGGWTLCSTSVRFGLSTSFKVPHFRNAAAGRLWWGLGGMEVSLLELADTIDATLQHPLDGVGKHIKRKTNICLPSPAQNV